MGGQQKRQILLEVCVDTLESVESAIEGGCDRLELCGDLRHGGLTPTTEFVSGASEIEGRSAAQVQLFAMLRPRPGNFHYSDFEISQMKSSFKELVELGVLNGIVFGCLKPTKNCTAGKWQVDIETTTSICALAREKGLSVTFHRAFDEIKDASKALEDLISCGVDRVLTSGGATTADDGSDTIEQLIKQGKGRVIVMPGAGITEFNVERIVQQTGATEVHGSFREVSETTYKTSRQCVQTVKEILSSLENQVTL